MRIYLDFLTDGRVSAIDASNGNCIAIGDYVKIMSLIYPLGKVVTR